MDATVGTNRTVKTSMRTATKGMLSVIALVAVMAMAGTASAIEPVSGDVNSTVAQGNVVTLTVEGGTPGRYVTAVVGPVNPTLNDYAYSNIDPLLINAGIPSGGTYNATIVMLCSGTQCTEDGVMGDSYTNTLRNTTPTTAYIINAVRNGATDFASLMELESCAVEVPFSKTLYAGWNLISLPLTPSDNSTSAVLSTVAYNAVYRYNATSKEFESADAMDQGTGYFVHATSDCTWVCSGTPYTSIDASLKHGLNMVGWLNCSKNVDALSSISGDYYYVAQWNTSAQKFDLYNPVAPSTFNDFATMDRGTGYFISAKQGCMLSGEC
jgi:hypothetical protein